MAPYITALPNGHQTYWNRQVNVIRHPNFRNEKPIIVYQDDTFDIKAFKEKDNVDLPGLIGLS